MTEGFDAATPQAGIDFTAAAHSGREFVFVKAGGGNVGLYVAPHYIEQVDAARKAGLHVGHTFLTGRAATPAASASYFVKHLHSFNGARDALALDNERFPDEPGSQMWNDSQVAEFWTEVFRLLPGHPHRVAFTYGDESHLTALAPWTKTNKLGTSWWVARYSANDGARHTLPTVPGCKVSIHQYTSVGRLGGRTVDLDWSPLTVGALFGAVTVKLPAPVAKPATPAAASPATPTPAAVTPAATPTGDDDMPALYFKGADHADVFILNRTTGKKRHIGADEWAVAGLNQTVHEIAQAHADAIPSGA